MNYNIFTQNQQFQFYLLVIEYWIKIIVFIFKILVQEMDLDELNPNWREARNHGKAMSVGHPPDKEDQPLTSVCPCCLNVINKRPAPLCENAKQLEFIGFGFPLFYSFLKNCILLLLLSICSYNCLSLYWAVKHNQFSNQQKQANHLSTRQHHFSSHGSSSSISALVYESRIEGQITPQQQVLRIFSFMIHLIFLIYIRDKILKLLAYYDQRKCTLSDFSIMLRGIPVQDNIQHKIRQFFRTQFRKPHQIKSLTLLTQLSQFQQLNKQKKIIIDSLRPFYQEQNYNDEWMKLKQELAQHEKLIQQQVQKFKLKHKKDELQAVKAILVFNSEQEKQKIIEEFETMKDYKKESYFGDIDEYFIVTEAPQPREILWENIEISSRRRVGLVIVSWSLSLLVLAIVAVIFFFVNEQKAFILIDSLEKYHEDPERYQKKLNSAIVLVYVMLIFIVLFNKFVMSYLFHKFTHMERQQNSSNFQFSFGLKYCLGLFFTTALMTIAVQAIKLHNYFSHPYGVIDEETIMFIFNALFVPLFWLVNPFQIYKLIKRGCSYGRKDLTQTEANKLMQDYPYDMGKRYAQIIQTMWFTYLYASLIPIGAFISLAGLIIYYWIDKFNLLRRASLQAHVQGTLTNFSLKLLDFTLFFWSAGILLFDHQIRNSVSIWSILMLVASIIYLAMPINSFIEFFNEENFFNEQKTYDQVKHLFYEDYQSLHPVNTYSRMRISSPSLLRMGYIINHQKN